ncbi:YgfZ/GcvT domain-containing protein [Stappia stellulata]|uniref:CAF17-like 4Fe-4S cluster assembly/insertion protein YgfZ n=1 Tax=Stappia stellulata TaxID=71235 RepID=UPI00040EF8AA|nr:folate-binding protein YgfZ [Stappia stellulata]
MNQTAHSDETDAGGLWVPLTERRVLRVAGDEARGFLQNLVTCDLDDVDSDGAGYGALLTPQGKILFDFLIFAKDGAYLLDSHSSIAADLAKRLGFYKLRAKVEIADASDSWRVIATWGDVAPTGVSGIALPDPRLASFGHRVLAETGTGEAPRPSGFRESDEGAYHARRVAFALPEAPHDFQFGDAFPHDADMDDLHGVAFDKGCFVGQEVVSRMQHRGTARRRIVRVKADAPLPAPGSAVTAGGKAAGTLGTTDGAAGLAMVRLDRVEGARTRGEPILAGDVCIEAHLPAWATFVWPATAGGDA